MSIEWTQTGGQEWAEMPPELFDRSKTPKQGSLFGLTVEYVKPKTGPQLDLFGPPDEFE